MIPVIADSKKSATRMFALDNRCKYHSRNVDDLTRHIDYWFEHRDEMKEMRDKDAEFVKQFDFVKCMDNMEKMLVEVKEAFNKKLVVNELDLTQKR